MYFPLTTQLAQVFGGILIGFLLDIPSLRRRTRSRLAWSLAFILTCVIYGGGLKFQLWINKRKTLLDFADAKECESIYFSIQFDKP